MRALKLLERPSVIGLAFFFSFWPVWSWYVARLQDGADEPFGPVALILCLLILFFRYRATALAGELPPVPLIAILFLYLLTAGILPFLLKAILAATGIAYLLSRIFVQKNMQAGICMLLILSLPVIASLQFYGGYPIRLITSEAVAVLLRLSGTFAQAEGTVLKWAGELVAIDAPCAGIKMLWSGMLINAIFSAWWNYSWRLALVASLCSSFLIFLANVFRSYVLFYRETGLVSVPLSHEGVGILVFFLLAQLLCCVHILWLRKIR